ncbi:MAG: hypothetical protein UV79_C0006G0014 [candidate division TM6 bacterium GW2011_GWF2_43_17]|nr:MAG: hypothetical protein UV79_C0006G0014 [candidate division TM6 bacterium GW2011_GWF2_43_17]
MRSGLFLSICLVFFPSAGVAVEDMGEHKNPEVFVFTDEGYQAHKETIEKGTGSIIGWARFQQRNLLLDMPEGRTAEDNTKIREAQQEFLSFLQDESVPRVEFVLTTPDKNGLLPLQRFVLNSCADFDVQVFLRTIFENPKVPLLKILADFDTGEPNPLIVLLIERFPVFFIEDFLRLIFEDQRFGAPTLKKLLSIESSFNKKTVARLLAERLLSFNEIIDVGLNRLITLDRRLAFLRATLEEAVSLIWLQYPLSHQELSQVLINYIVSNNKEKLFKAYLERLFSVVLPYTVQVLTVLSKESKEQVFSVLLKYGLAKPLISFLLTLKPENKDLSYAKILLLTPNGLGKAALYQALEGDFKGLVLAILLIGKSFIDELVLQGNDTSGTVVHLAAQKQANEFFSAVVPLLVERKKLNIFFKLLKSPGPDGKTAINHLIAGANLDLLKKLANHYAPQFKKVLAATALKEGALHKACRLDNEKLVTFLLQATRNVNKGKNKLLFSYDEDGLSPLILSIEEQYFSALQALLTYAHKENVLSKALNQKDKNPGTPVHYSAFQHALLHEDENPFLLITSFLQKRGLRKLFDILLKSEASNKKRVDELLEEFGLSSRKKLFSFLQGRFVLTSPKNTLNHCSSLTTFSPTTKSFDEPELREKTSKLSSNAERVISTGNFSKKASMGKVVSMLNFSKDAALSIIPFDRQVFEM